MAGTLTQAATRPLRLALIYGSTRRGRFCDTIANWAMIEIERHGGFMLDRVDPAHSVTDHFAGVLDAADAYLVLVPEYNHGYPAPLKALIDAYYDQWQAKPVAFVSYGGVSGGIRAVEQLRQVFAELHAVTVRDAVSFANAADQFDGQGQLHAPARARRNAATMLARLHWWAMVLQEARRTRPYAEVLE
jgi:NAD(P)H-dependent FMN reductase